MKNKLQAYPNILQSIGLTVLIVAFLQGFTLLLFLLSSSFAPMTAIFLIGYTVAMSCCIWIAQNFRRVKKASPIPLFQKMNSKAVLLIIIATLALDFGIATPVTGIIPISESTQQTLIQNFGNLDVFMFIAIVFGAPFFEEYLFRGFMLDGLLENYSPLVAISVSSILFGIMHINPLQLASATIGGFFLGWVYYKSRNLSYCMLIHLIINLTGFILLQQINIESIFEKGIVELYGGIGNMICLFIVALLILSTCIWWLNQIFKQPQSNITV